MIILGIETSCDETSVALIQTTNKNSPVKLLTNVISSSLNLHSKTGGIIPEIAAREQIRYMLPVLQEALEKGLGKNVSLEKTIDAIAVTYGPGLIGSLLVGIETARTLAWVLNKPIIPVNHMIGHIYANWIIPNEKPFATIAFPAIALVVSGGHTDLLLLRGHGDLQLLGGTRDDAAGECFDKCARLIGYNYPGGPKIAELAKKGNPHAFQFPRPMLGNQDYEFSFSGLKTAFLNTTKQHFQILRTNDAKIGWQQTLMNNELSETDKQKIYDLCASLQQAIIEVLAKKTMKAAKEYHAKSILLSGGVSANETLRTHMKLSVISHKLSAKIFVPENFLCTDNAGMIAAAGFYTGQEIPWQDVTADPELYF